MYIKFWDHGMTVGDPIKLSKLPTGEYEVKKILSGNIAQLAAVIAYDIKGRTKVECYVVFPENVSFLKCGVIYIKGEKNNFEIRLPDYTLNGNISERA